MLKASFFYLHCASHTKRASQVTVANTQKFSPQDCLSIVTPEWLQLLVIPYYKIIGITGSVQGQKSFAGMQYSGTGREGDNYPNY